MIKVLNIDFLYFFIEIFLNIILEIWKIFNYIDDIINDILIHDLILIFEIDIDIISMLIEDVKEWFEHFIIIIVNRIVW